MKLFYLLFIFYIFTDIAVGQQTVYNTSGSHTFITHSSVIELTVEAIGGGGGGGLVRRSSATQSGGGGGSAYAKGKVNVTSNAGHSIYVARGGKKQRGDSDARHGENSWFYSGTSTDASTTVRAEGGQTLLHNDNQDVNGKPGGNAANCVGNIARYTGGHGGSTSSNSYGGGGGGAAGSTGDGTPGGQYNAGSGNSGLLLSGHAPGAGGVGGINNGDDDGVPGANYGGGGGGARKSNSVVTSNRDGSPGAIGIVVISWSHIDNIPAVCQGAPTTIISGFNFSTTMPNGTPVTTTSVTLNGTPLTYTINSNTQISINLPVGAMSGNVIVTTTLGRAQYHLTINTDTNSTAPTSVSGGGDYCFGNQVTLTANGSTLGTGANYRWYTGSCGGTLLAITNIPTYSFTANSGGSDTYFVRAEGTCNTTTCASTTVTLPTPNMLGTDGESATCNINAGETVHFFERTSGNYIASVTAGVSSLGSVDATVFVKGTPLYVPACTSPTDLLYTTHVLQRHWIITPVNNRAATVRLPYTSGELAALSPLANGNPNPDDNVSGHGDLQLSKYSGSTINSTPFDNCPVGATTIHGPGTSGSIGYLTPGFTGHLYSQYSIPGFSEFYLHGGSTSTPLAVTLSHFSATCENYLNRISWKTENEQNTSHFIVERSENGYDWNEVEIIQSNGAKNGSNHYETIDATNQETYYRLKLIDYNGNTNTLETKHIKCKSFEENKLIIYPNPANVAFTVEIHSDESKNGTIQLYDLTGKLIFSQLTRINKGVNTVYLNENLRKGVYVLNIQTEGHQFKPTQVIIK